MRSGITLLRRDAWAGPRSRAHRAGRRCSHGAHWGDALMGAEALQAAGSLLPSSVFPAHSNLWRVVGFRGGALCIARRDARVGEAIDFIERGQALGYGMQPLLVKRP